jgi:RNA recognition motif-containing protein
MNIYVGNLSYDTDSDQLRDTFASYGEVASASVVSDKFTGRSRGFGFVEMPDDGEARAAIEALNGTELHGRPLTVNEARPRPERSGGGRGGFGGGGRGGDRRGGGGGGRW